MWAMSNEQTCEWWVVARGITPQFHKEKITSNSYSLALNAKEPLTSGKWSLLPWKSCYKTYQRGLSPLNERYVDLEISIVL